MNNFYDYQSNNNYHNQPAPNQNINPNINQNMNQGISQNMQQNTNYNSQPNMNMNNQPNPINNLNFNKCNYDQKGLQPSELYDPYSGFVRGNMFPDLYNQYKIPKPYHIEPLNEQAQLLTYVDGLSFATHDLNLYLDTHPDDQSIIQLYNQYRVESEQALKQYENSYGPLFVSSDTTNTYPWAWNQLPWPWENK